LKLQTGNNLSTKRKRCLIPNDVITNHQIQ